MEIILDVLNFRFWCLGKSGENCMAAFLMQARNSFWLVFLHNIVIKHVLSLAEEADNNMLNRDEELLEIWGWTFANEWLKLLLKVEILHPD